MMIIPRRRICNNSIVAMMMMMMMVLFSSRTSSRTLVVAGGGGESGSNDVNEEEDSEAIKAALTAPVKYVMEGEKENDVFRLNDMPGYWYPKQRMPCPHLYTSYNKENNNNITIYSPTWHDRSGAVVRRMIYSYAYAHKYGYKYGGSINRVLETQWPRHRLVHEALIDSLGMSDALRFVEPPSKNNLQHLHLPELCIHNIELDDTFVQHLRTLQVLPSREELFGQQNSHKLQVAVHMRRGDAHPCTDFVVQSERYTANSYYQKILDEYVFVDGITEDDAVVTIFSESDTFETFDEFIDRGYHVKLDGLATDAWAFMVQCDVLIVSPNSFFSFVPGLFNPNHRVYSNIEEQDFIQVREGIMIESLAILEKVKDEKCDDWLEEHPWHKTTVMNW